MNIEKIVAFILTFLLVVLMRQSWTLRSLCDRRSPKKMLILLALASVGAVGAVTSQKPQGGKPLTVIVGDPMQTASTPLDDLRIAKGANPAPTNKLTSAEYKSGFALREARGAPPDWDTPPHSAITNAAWSLGMIDDCFWLDMEGWRFPVRERFAIGVFPLINGMICFNLLHRDLPDTLPIPDNSGRTFLAPLKGSIGCAQSAGSTFWHHIGTNTVIFTWHSVLLNRNANFPITFQVQLYRNGDFVYRYKLLNPSADYSAVLDNFLVGAQHNGGGVETKLERLLPR